MSSTRSNARLIRFGVFALILIGCGYILTRGSSFQPPSYTLGGSGSSTSTTTPAQNANKGAAAVADPNLANYKKKDLGPLPKFIAFEGQDPQQVPQKNIDPTTYSPKDKVKATFVSLARNSDLYSLVESIIQIEDRFNKKYHYDWTFLNEKEFSQEFKDTVSNLVSGKCNFGFIPKEHWSYPEWIDQEKAALVREQMREKKIIYGHSESYRHMCRFESGFFWRQDVLKDYEYYWRVEPDTKIYCDIDYDVFKWMKDNGKEYSFTISLPEYKETIPTLWKTTKEFIEKNPQYLAPNNMMEWVSDDKGESYNGCHFWSNFEIGSLNFWRSDPYKKYFEYLDKAGGFFYERWGDAPVHSIAAALFLPREKIHFFEDIGYFHVPFHNCPVDPEIRKERRCHCNPDKDFTWRGYSCTTKYYTINNFKRQKHWEKYTQ
ncbi:glycolipid 2-alpha-mannosyltransferase [Lodderomyces elongisporus NRRL YB-4239]|uniref:Glycolipid 2-alpha-mannosyltransferase n=1 Tax=Lodderomyces elongisporus (strain ATCC 11503 / CBS 2605 / JCM 1781 / NBRC 1676 / NRRL YB-4239) TaxID=379508 RepID=A5DY05_LODEL|nr:glycolipid 2-alpha-mannosyltransferase [Lodderomyces elongisporus NRRL YB-4239]